MVIMKAMITLIGTTPFINQLHPRRNFHERKRRPKKTYLFHIPVVISARSVLWIRQRQVQDGTTLRKMNAKTIRMASLSFIQRFSREEFERPRIDPIR